MKQDKEEDDFNPSSRLSPSLKKKDSYLKLILFDKQKRNLEKKRFLSWKRIPIQVKQLSSIDKPFGRNIIIKIAFLKKTFISTASLSIEEEGKIYTFEKRKIELEGENGDSLDIIWRIEIDRTK